MNTSIGGGGGSHTERVSNPISRFSFGHYAILLLLIPIVLLTCGYAVDPLQAIAVTDPDDLVRITSFDLHVDNTDASGITYDGTHLFVTDLTASKVFVYDLGGNHIRDYSTTADQSGIGFGNDISYVVTNTNKVYIDDPSDGTFSSQFKDFGSDGGQPVGITVSNGLLVVNSTSVSHYGFNSSTAFPKVSVINGIFIKPDGTSMYISVDYPAHDDDHVRQYGIAQYDLSTPWDTSTATAVPGFNEQDARDGEPSGIHNVHFSTNGSLVYYVSYNGDTVYQYNMSTPWDLSTTVSSSASEYSNDELTKHKTKSITFNTLGSVMYIGSTGSIYQFSLTTPWDVTTAVYDSKSKTIPSEIKSISFDPSGTKLYMASGTYGAAASQYTLSTPWDVSTASLDDTYTVEGIVNADSNRSNRTAILSDLFFDSTGTIVYFTDTLRTVYQYNTLTPWDITDTTVGSRLLFNLDDTNNDPTGITHVNKTVFITDNNPPSVYQYVINGDPLLDGSMLHAQNDDPVGITSIGANYLYVADANGNKIHVYDLASDFSTPDAPTNLSASATRTVALLSWNESFDGGTAIIGYTVEYLLSDTNGWVQVQNGSKSGTDSLQISITDLVAGTEYKFRVAAVNSNGTGSFSAIATATTLPDKPAKPTGLVAVPSDTSVSLSWTAPSDNGDTITDYIVEYVDIDGDNTWILFSDGSSADASATVTGLTVRTDYKFRVAAINSIGTGSYSETASATTLDVPGKPTGLVAVPSDTSVSLIWTAPSDNGGSPITSYSVQYVASGDANWNTHQDGNTTTNTTPSATISSLAQDTQYTFRVAAVNNIGQGVYSANATKSTDAPTLPDAPTISGNPTSTLDSVSISWNEPDNGGSTITSYSVQYVASGDSIWTTHQNGNSTANTALSATISSLAQDTQYTFRVAAVNNIGQGVYSANVTKSTDAPTVPDAPAISTNPTSTLDSVSISWNEPDNGGSSITSYSVQYVASGDSSWNTHQNGNSTANTTPSATISSLAQDTQYTFRVAAVNNIGQGVYSANVTKSTDAPTVPDAPAISTNPTSTLDSVSISWNEPDNGGSSITSYSVQYVASGDSSWNTHQNGNSTANTTPSATISSLAQDTQYTFRVAAVNSIGQGVYSANVTKSTDAPTVPDAPAISTNPTSTLDSVSISWNEPDNGGSTITSYSVQYVASGDSSWNTHQNGNSTANTTPSATISSLAQDTQYTFRVAAVNSIGQGVYSANVTKSTDAPTVPDAPAISGNPTSTLDSVSISWNEPDNGGSSITSYSVQYVASGDSSWNTHQNGNSTANTTPSATISSLAQDTQYTFRVAAVNSIGQGVYSANVTKSTDAPTVPDAPAISTNPTSTLDSVSISWNEPDNGGSTITSYSVQYVASGDSSWNTHQNGNSTTNTTPSATIPGLTS